MNKNLFWLFCLCAFTHATQGFDSLPSASIFYYLKETLHYSPSTVQYIQALIPLAWLIKPLFGFFIDSSKYSKKIWIFGSLIGCVLLNLILGLSPIFPVFILVGLMILINFMDAFRSTTVNSIMCSEGKHYGITGKLQSYQWGALSLASVLVGVCGGYIAQHWSYQIAYLILLPIYVILLFISWKFKESERVIQKFDWKNIIKKLLNDKNLLLVGLFIFLYNFSPDFSTPLKFIQRDSFHWSKLFIGQLETLSAIMGVLGAFLYYHFSKVINFKKCLFISLFISASITLFYLHYTPLTAIIYLIIGSFLGMIFSLMMLDFMARNTQHGLEATSFALLCSINNITGTANSLTGAFLLPLIGLTGLIIISSFTTFMCIPLIKYLKNT